MAEFIIVCTILQVLRCEEAAYAGTMAHLASKIHNTAFQEECFWLQLQNDTAQKWLYTNKWELFIPEAIPQAE